MAAHPRFVMHFTPTSASWLNMIERFFRNITDKHIRRDSFISVAELELAIDLYVAHHNIDPKPFIWTARASDILAQGRARQGSTRRPPQAAKRHQSQSAARENCRST